MPPRHTSRTYINEPTNFYYTCPNNSLQPYAHLHVIKSKNKLHYMHEDMMLEAFGYFITHNTPTLSTITYANTCT